MPGVQKEACAFAGPVDVFRRRQGVLAVLIGTERLPRFPGTLQPGGFGAAFLLDINGKVIAAPDPNADEITPARMGGGALFDVAAMAGEQLLGPASARSGAGATIRIVSSGVPHAAALAPLGFCGWRVVTVIPEPAFLSEIDRPLKRAAATLTLWS